MQYVYTHSCMLIPTHCHWPIHYHQNISTVWLLVQWQEHTHLMVKEHLPSKGLEDQSPAGTLQSNGSLYQNVISSWQRLHHVQFVELLLLCSHTVLQLFGLKLCKVICCCAVSTCVWGPGRKRFGDFGDPSDLDMDPDRGGRGMRRQAASAGQLVQAAQLAQLAQAQAQGKGRSLGLQEICENYLGVLGTLEKRISTWNQDDLVREWKETQEEVRLVREEYALVVGERLDMEKRQAELLETRQKLLEELEYWRDAPKRGCIIS